MTLPPDHRPDSQTPAPSWFGPIALGAGFTALLAILYLGIAQLVPTLGCVVFCCSPIVFSTPAGILPVILVLRRDPTLTPGQAFSVSFIAVGLGSSALAAPSVIAGPGMSRAELEAHWRDQFQQLVERGGADYTTEEIDELVQFVVSALPYMPVILAAVASLLAGFAGMVFVRVLRARAVPPGHASQ